MLHIIQNDPEVPPGNLLEGLNRPCLLHYPYLDGRLPDRTDISALIVLGGAMGANDDARYPFLSDLKWLIREVVEAGIPYLGICLGGQLLAAALGGRVVSSRWEELGTMPVQLTDDGRCDPLFVGLEQEFCTFQWHHDSFDLPEGALLLAGSAVCPHQAFRVGNNAWGLQFHPEVTAQIIRDWCRWDAERTAHTDTLCAAFTAQLANYQATSSTLMRNFLQQVASREPASQSGQAAAQRSGPARPGGGCRPG